MKATITPRLCDACGDQAIYTTRDVGHDLCDECARNRGAESNGRVLTAFAAFGFAIGIARGEGVRDAQIREAFEDILTAPHSYATYDVGGDHVLGGSNREDRPWARILREVQS